ncbi:uncharacterized protein LOC114519461 [Dendronephthya gigantea]|uniref:uncharacterized protein LOC114519461 n=1 Tax=Dendronephthya gigantea TaxID=151771 RepID=UPI00106BAE35|nr:uncharacterized protein LOC114519461 [Dendronephthya gigantea]
MERDNGLQKPVVFPFLIEEPKASHQDATNRSFLNGMMTKWSRNHNRRTPMVKDAFPPSKTVLHGRERYSKGFHSPSHKEMICKSYSCPKIIDMSNIDFYQDRVSQRQPRRIFNGFFPNKILTTQGCIGNDHGAAHSTRGRTLQPQVGMCLQRKDSANFTGLSSSRELHSSGNFHRPSYQSTDPNVGHFGCRRSDSSWPVRNGSPSPWLQRYKLKKRATTSYALKTGPSGQDYCEPGDHEIRPKRSQKYVNISTAVILDAF